MKRLCLFSIIIAFVMASTPVYAEERVPQRAPLGNGNLAVKLDYIVFTDPHWGDHDDDGLYIGLEGYGEITRNLYLGGEVGGTFNVTVFGDDMTFYPIELNLKYAIEAAPNFVIDFGAGASYTYTEIRRQYFVPPRIKKDDDWLFGGQFFADITYKIRWFFIGVNTKYQITEDFKDEDFDLNNWRVGAQIGVTF